MARLEPTSGFNFLMFVLVASSSLCAQGRIHHLELQNDRRGQVRLMSFGFHRGGYLELISPNLHLYSTRENSVHARLGSAFTKAEMMACLHTWMKEAVIAYCETGEKIPSHCHV
uniref:Uncharacterized protein n=1 Tax=Eptatretus burgeri TaxID=7764 RepID=A0A8C4QAY3_EPTBU